MKCPNCGATLQMTTRSEVEIDYCPECRGIWLDRGELDKILERATSERRELGRPEIRREELRGYDAPVYDKRKRMDDSDIFDSDLDRRYYDDDRRYSNDPNSYKKKKRSGILDDIFDIFG
jgi:uncharacterized protein